MDDENQTPGGDVALVTNAELGFSGTQTAKVVGISYRQSTTGPAPI